MKIKRALLITGGTGCGIVSFGACIITGFFFFVFAVFVLAVPKAEDFPDLWYTLPGGQYVAFGSDCETEWETIEGEAGLTKYCERLEASPSVAEGAPTSVIVRYTPGHMVPPVESVELIISPYEPEPPADSENGQINGSVFAATLEEQLDLEDCLPTYTRFFNSGAFDCDDIVYTYAGRISVEPDVTNEMRLWIAPSVEFVDQPVIEFATEEHRRVSELFLARGNKALENDDYIEAEKYYSRIAFVMERISGYGAQTTEDKRLIEEAAENHDDIVGKARKARHEAGINAPLPRYYGFVHLPALLGQDNETLMALLDAGFMECSIGGDEADSCTYSDGLYWDVHITFDEAGYSQKVQILTLDIPDLALDEEFLEILNLPVVAPDYQDDDVIRWENVIDQIAYVEASRPEGSDRILIEAGL